MALTASRNLTIERLPGAGTLNAEATDAVQFYRGGFVGLNNTTGYVVKPTDAAAVHWFGIASRDVLGDTAASPPPKVEVITGPFIVRNHAVVGASAVTHQGDLVYLTDDNTLTLTATVNTKAVGFVLKWITGTSCDVHFFSPGESRAL